MNRTKQTAFAAVLILAATAHAQTSRGTVTAPVVVNAAGAWAAQVAKFAGVDLPVEPLRRMLVPSEPFDDFPHSSPMVIDMLNGFHFRPEGRGFLLAWNDPEETSSYNTDFEPAFIEKILTLAANRVPAFENLAVNPKRAWAGLYEMTPDQMGIISRVPGVAGLHVLAGFSGHGFMHGPIAGQLMAELIADGRAHTVDIAPLDIERFKRAEVSVEVMTFV